MNKHTQGEWKVGLNTATNEWMQVFVNNKPIATALPLSKKGERKQNDFKEEEANAKLIASAPTLLNQLNKNHEVLLSVYQYLGSKDAVLAEKLRTEMYNTLEAIKKVKGE